MKRLLLSCALIGATFACNAMDPVAIPSTPEEKYNHIKALEEHSVLTVKQVDEYLLDNEYLRNNREEFLEFALEIQQKLEGDEYYRLTSFLKTADTVLSDMSARQSANSLLGSIRIVEIAHDLCWDVNDHDQLYIHNLKQKKDLLEVYLAIAHVAEEENNPSLISSVPSAIFSRNGAIGLAVLVAGYFGISYWNSSKKAPQDN